MDVERDEADGHRPDDKVRSKIQPGESERAIIREVNPAWLRIETEAGELTVVPPEAVTNYSLAARRAWRTMPKRAGRPLGSRQKRMVSWRIDADVRDMLESAVEAGLIPNREQAVNSWLRLQLRGLLGKPSDRTGQEDDRRPGPGDPNGPKLMLEDGEHV